jgi:hypothetical protein
MGGEVFTGCVARIWEEDDSVLSSALLTWKTDPFIFYSSSLGPSMCTWGVSKPDCKLQSKVNGGPTTGAC